MTGVQGIHRLEVLQGGRGLLLCTAAAVAVIEITVGQVQVHEPLHEVKMTSKPWSRAETP